MMMMVNGMKESGSFLSTVLVTATNFIASVRCHVFFVRYPDHVTIMTLHSQALAGLVIFGETLSLLWWFGASCILFGVVLITSDREAIKSPAAQNDSDEQPAALKAGLSSGRGSSAAKMRSSRSKK
jgi:drug/metabolite transporter (DMT)-like permease